LDAQRQEARTPSEDRKHAQRQGRQGKPPREEHQAKTGETGKKKKEKRKRERRGKEETGSTHSKRRQEARTLWTHKDRKPALQAETEKTPREELRQG
jgi:hypothetical protein